MERLLNNFSENPTTTCWQQSEGPRTKGVNSFTYSPTHQHYDLCLDEQVKGGQLVWIGLRLKSTLKSTSDSRLSFQKKKSSVAFLILRLFHCPSPVPRPRRRIRQYHLHVSSVEYHRALLHAGVQPLVAYQHLPAHTQGTPRNARPQPPPRLQGPPGHIIGSFDSIVSQLRRDIDCKIHCEDSVAATEEHVILVIGSFSPHRPLELADGHVDFSNTQEAVVRVFKRVWELKAEKANKAVNNGRFSPSSSPTHFVE
ncbi:hypothetical protein Fmac_032758 [Flemingia macrophylla]|uniref:Uncharacterized protein n=1 Tax=Flemingia macrophylla TaxID=520843 RepID=A0ABD1L5V5_9FABA